VRRLVLVALTAAAVVAGAGASPARATNECRGLMVCVRVAGPWVVVPRGGAAPRPRVEFQLSCPRGFVVGGTDAELSDRGIDISFLGKLGSPVGPGVTTERAAVFVATYAGSAARATSFRPHLGCLPTTGGGGGPVPYRPPSAAPTVPPDEPTIRRVRTVRLRPGAIHARQGCAAGELLVSGWHAVGFYTAHPPTASLVAAVAATRHVRGGRVDVVAHVTVTVRGVHAILQVGAVCGGGR
jgi:hypothetical protein